IVAFNDDVAFGVLEELTRRKISVPGQVSVVGFDDAPNAHAASPPLTTASQHAYEQGAAAMTHLIDAVKNGQALSNQTIRPEVVYRESCGCHSTMASSTRDILVLDDPVTADSKLREDREEIARLLARVAQGRLHASSGWEARLVD